MPASTRIRGLLGAALLALAALGVGVAAGCAPAGPSSVVLVVVDTLRADHLGAYGYERPTSPAIDRWAASAAVFEHAFAPSPWTLPSIASMLTGRLPTEHGAGVDRKDELPEGTPHNQRFQRLGDGIVTLAEIFSAEGYATGALINNSFLHPRFELDRGFDSYDYAPGRGKKSRRADEVVDLALQWIADREGPYFLLVHIFDPHWPYAAPEGFRGSFLGKRTLRSGELKEVRAALRAGEPIDLDAFAAAYDEEIAFTDRELGRLLEGLGEAGDEPVVFLTSDHGEEFGEHGGFEHGHTVYNELLQVPLILSGPGISAGRSREPVTLLDLGPTLLDAAGLEVPQGFSGRSLLNRQAAASERLLIAERTLYGAEKQALIRWPFKLIWSPGRSKSALYDLERDFAETRDLGSQDPDRARRMAGSLDRVLATLERATAGEAELDDEVLEELRSLGYIE